MLANIIVFVLKCVISVIKSRSLYEYFLCRQDCTFSKAVEHKQRSSQAGNPFVYVVLRFIRSLERQHPTTGVLPVRRDRQVRELRWLQPYQVRWGLMEPKEYDVSSHLR